MRMAVILKKAKVSEKQTCVYILIYYPADKIFADIIHKNKVI